MNKVEGIITETSGKERLLNAGNNEDTSAKERLVNKKRTLH